MVAEIKRRDPAAEVQHESLHCALIFKIKKRLPKLRIPMLMLPDSKLSRNEFIEALKCEIDSSVGDKLETLYNAINKVSSDLKLIRTVRGYRKLKFYWSDEDYSTYKSMLADAYSHRGSDDET